MVSYDTECVFAIVRILKGTIPLQILIFLYFFFDLLIFVRSSYTAFKEALPLQGEQDGSLVREKEVLPDLVCRLIMQQLRFACHPAPPFP